MNYTLLETKKNEAYNILDIIKYDLRQIESLTRYAVLTKFNIKRKGSELIQQDVWIIFFLKRGGRGVDKYNILKLVSKHNPCIGVQFMLD